MPNYTVIYSERSTMELQITRDAKVVVRAPRFTSNKQIRAFVREHRDWVERNLAQRVAWNEAHPEPDSEEEARLRTLAGKEIPGRVAYYASLMGVEPAGVRITSARTRFGSCSGKDRLCFSWRVMAYPMEAVDYVVVHELSHILFKNHSADFYRCIESVLPDWKQRRELLKR